MKFMKYFLVVVTAGCFLYSCSTENKSEDISDVDAMSESADAADASDLTYDASVSTATNAEDETYASADGIDEVSTTDGEAAADSDLGNSNNTYTDAQGNLVYTFAEEKPTYIGGDKEMYSFLSKNLKYPEKAIDNKAEGTVHVAFVVGQSGSIRDVEIAKGLEDASLNAEALRVVSQMPAWAPGRQSGETVDVKYTLPVKFDLKN